MIARASAPYSSSNRNFVQKVRRSKLSWPAVADPDSTVKGWEYGGGGGGGGRSE